jgi:hypothetical protein
VEPNAAVQPNISGDRRRKLNWLCLGAGVLLGLGIAALWPQRPLTAACVDRNEKFAMCTATVTEGLEAVFVLDFLTGRLRGSCLHPQSGTHFVVLFEADVGTDLGVKAAKPQYAMVPGYAKIRSTPGVQPAGSVLYVAELSTGKVGCYAIPLKLPNTPNPVPQLLLPMPNAQFQFRDAVVE